MDILYFLGDIVLSPLCAANLYSALIEANVVRHTNRGYGNFTKIK